MALSAEQRQKFLNDLQQHANQLVSALNDADDLLTRWFDLGLSGEFTQSDFEPSHLNHLDADTVTDAVSTFEALRNLANAGHRANLNKVIR